MLHHTDLPALLLEPDWADRDPERRLVLALDLRGWTQSGGRTAELSLRLDAWLQRQSVPTLVLAEPGVDLDGADLLVRDAPLAEELLAAIRRNPVAAALLVQTTRTVAALPLEQALIVESLAYSTLQGGAEFAAWLQRNRSFTGRRPAGQTPPILLLERRGDDLQLRLNSPANRNALSAAMRDALTDAFRLVAMDSGIRRVHVSGAGPSFSAGGDLTEFGSAKDPAAAHQVRQLRMPARYLALAGARYHFHLHGACIGAGVELAAFAGRISAREDSFFQLPEVAMGLIPGAGGCVSLVARIGRQRTNHLAISGRKLAAREALAWGLIDELEPGVRAPP